MQQQQQQLGPLRRGVPETKTSRASDTRQADGMRGGARESQASHTFLAFIKPLLGALAAPPSTGRAGATLSNPKFNTKAGGTRRPEWAGGAGRPAGVVISLQLNIRPAGGRAKRPEPLFLASSCFQTYTPTSHDAPVALRRNLTLSNEATARPTGELYCAARPSGHFLFSRLLSSFNQI